MKVFGQSDSNTGAIEYCMNVKLIAKFNSSKVCHAHLTLTGRISVSSRIKEQTMLGIVCQLRIIALQKLSQY